MNAPTKLELGELQLGMQNVPCTVCYDICKCSKSLCQEYCTEAPLLQPEAFVSSMISWPYCEVALYARCFVDTDIWLLPPQAVTISCAMQLSMSAWHVQQLETKSCYELYTP